MGLIGWGIIIASFLTLCSLFFALSAISLRTYSPGKLQEAFEKAGKERLLNSFSKYVEQITLACAFYRQTINLLLMVTLLIIFSGMEKLSVGSIFISVVLATLLFSAFGLAIPHACAKYSGEKFLCATYSLLKFFSIIAWPVVYAMQAYDRLVKRLVGVSDSTPEEEQEEKQEEFITGLEHHRLEGVVDEEEQEMIENVLELSDTSADEIMTPRTDIVAIPVDSDIWNAINTITTAGYSRLPVYEETIDNIVGILYAKDLLEVIGKDPSQVQLKEKLRPPYFVPETKSLRSLLHEFKTQQLHMAILLDEYGGTAGLITLEDILEELVGEINDEYEKFEPPAIERLNAATADVDARTYIDEINDELDIELPESEDYDTVGGFVFSHLGYIPKTGESFEFEKLKFTISAAEARKIDRIRIEKTAAE